VGCTGYPECRYIKKERRPEISTGVTCPECGQGQIVVKRSRRGKVFYGCNRYPDCKFAVWQRPVPEPCPTCGGLVTVQSRGKGKCTQCGTQVEVPEPPEAPAAEGGTVG
jgi:DNA topoisomerase-1